MNVAMALDVVAIVFFSVSLPVVSCVKCERACIIAVQKFQDTQHMN